MNTNSLQKTNPVPYPILLDAVAEIVEVQLSKQFEPTLLDLNQVFGAQDLKFEAAVETSGVVELKVLKHRGILILQSAEESAVGCTARVVVRATARDGLSTVVMFRVKAVAQQIAA